MSKYNGSLMMGKKPLAVALEQRFMFDAAGVATGAEVAEQNAIDTEAKAIQSSHGSDTSAVKEIYFIDSNVADYDQLIAGLDADAEYVVLNGDENGLDQMAAALSARSNLSAVHVLSHGGQGEVLLGTSSLSSATIEQNRDALEIIGQSLSDDGDILLYGCNIGTGSAGATFIGSLADVTGADVAASDDATGASGDWALEAKTGQIETTLGISLSAQENYQHDLATFDFTNAVDNGSNVTSTVSGITVTITSSEGVNVSFVDGGGFGGSSGNAAVAHFNQQTATSMTFTFSAAVNLTSLRAIDTFQTTTTNWTFTPNTGSAVTTSVDHNTGTTVDLSSLTGITSFTITSTSPVSYGVDTIVFTAAPTDPAITSATYDASAGTLVVTGTNFTATGGAANDVIANKITLTGEGGETYTLTDTANVEIGSGTQFTLTLSATDKAALNQIMNKNGTASTSATTYDVDGAAGFIAAKAAVSDTGVNGVTVSNVAAPTITSATYDYNSNVLTVTGANFLKKSGATNDIDVSKLTITGEGGATYTLATSSNVEITNGTTFSLTLSGADIQNVEALLNKDGTTSATSGTTFNLAGAEDWAVGADAAVNVADTTGNGITVSNYAVPTVTSATFNYATGVLTVTGTNFVSKSGASNDIDISKLAFTGEGGAQYQLTSASDVEITSATSYTVTLSGADLNQVRALLNKDGTTSETAGTTFSMASAEDWMAGSPAGNNVADAAATVTVSNYAVPTVTSATYDYNSNTLVVTGTNFVPASGGNNDIDISKLTFTGEGGATYTLTSASDVEITSGTSFTITLSGADLVNVESILNKNGTTSATSGQTYNLAAAEDWMVGVPAGNTIADTTGNEITVSNFANPVISSATYDWSTGVLVLTGTNFVGAAGANNDIDVTKLTITGEGGATYTLTSSNVDVSSATTASVTLNAADKLVIHGLLNKNGTSSDGATTYNVAAADNWAAGAPAANNIADATTGLTVSNYAAPTITSATYDYNSNTLVVTGTNFVSKSGANNDIDISKLTFTGEGGATYTLSSASDVEVTNATTFSVTLSGADIIGVESLLNKDGTTSATAGTTYNIAAADNWLAGGAASSDIADATGNAVTVSNYAVPAITSATYDWSNGQLVLTGTNFVSQAGASNDIDVTKLTITGEGGATYTLTSSNVDITSATSATVTLNAADKLAVHGLLNKNGTTSDGATTYNVAGAEDWAAGAPAGNTVADATTGITVSNYAAPTVTSATYDSDTGVLTVTGTNFVSKTGANNDIDISTLTFTGGTGNATYTLSSASDVEITSATSFSVTLSGADKTNVDALLDQIGTTSSAGSTYNIAAADNWLAGGPGSSDIADVAANAVTVSIAPKVTSATYDASTGSLVVTGTNIQANGGGADIDASKLTITGEGGATYTLTDTADVERTSATSFTLTLSATDKAALNQIMNKNDTSSTGATTYNVALADDWNTNVTAGNTADLTGNAVTVSNVAVPTITSATYDIATNQLVVTGTNFLKRSGATNDIDVSKLTITGEGGATYTLTSASDVEITNGTTFTITLSATDAAGVEALTSKNGTSADSGTTYNIAAAEDWAVGADSAVAVADLTGNGITVSNYAAPTITSATYDYNSNTLVVTGANFVSKSGATNDVDISKLTFTGEGGTTYTLTSASDVEITSATSFTITLSGADLVNVESILNKDGTTSATAGTTYNLAAADNWMTGAPATPDISDTTGNGITVSNFANPVVSSATYDWSTGVLVLTGTNFVGAAGANNDIDVTKLTITGEGGATYTLTSSNVDVSSATTASVTLNAADKLAIHGLLNKNGTSSDGATTYNVAAADNWAAGAPAANNIADATTGITVSNYVAPAITSATYDVSTGTLVVTGTNLQAKAGATNDIDASKITITGEGGEIYVLNNGTANVEIDSVTQFTLTLSAADKAALNQIMNKNGTSSTGATTYNVAFADGWNANVSGANDLTGNVVTVLNVAVPQITSATYDIATNQLVVTGTNFLKRDGAANDIDVSKLTFKGEGGATYTLSSASDVEITNGTTFTITLSATDAAGVEALTSKNGTSAANGTTYNLAAAEDWAVGADSAVTTVDGTSGVTVSNYNAPAITSVAYDYATGTLTLTGTNFVSKTGAANDIDVSLLSLTGQGNTAYTLTDSADVEITSATSAVITLSATDKLAVNGLLNKDGTTSATGATTFNLGAADNWMTGAFASVDIVDATNAVTVSNYAAPEITSATYDVTTKTLVVSGTNFVSKTGAANDVDVSQLTLTGKGGASSPILTSTDVEITSATEFTLVLNDTDAAAVAALLDANGTTATDGQTYNLAAAGSWLAQVPVDISDNTGNGITVSNVPTSSPSSGLNVSQIGGDEGSSEDTAGNEGNTNGNDGNGPDDNGAGNVNTPAGEVNFGNGGDRTTWNEVVNRGGSSSSVIDDPSAGVEGMTIVRNAVTGNDAALNSFYGTGRVSSSNSGGAAGGRAAGGIAGLGGARSGLSGLAGSGGGLNGLANGGGFGGGLGGGFAGGLGGGFGGSGAGDPGLGGVGDGGASGNGVGEPGGIGNGAPVGEDQPIGDERLPGGEQASRAPQGGRMNFSAQLANASGANDLKVVKVLLEAG